MKSQFQPTQTEVRSTVASKVAIGLSMVALGLVAAGIVGLSFDKSGKSSVFNKPEKLEKTERSESDSLLRRREDALTTEETCTEIRFPDRNLERAVRELEEVPEDGPICAEYIEDTGTFNAVGDGIVNLEGMQYFTNVVWVCLDFNDISDISPLTKLSNLRNLYINYNNIVDISSFSEREMASLKTLAMSFNEIENIKPLMHLRDLEYLNLRYNNISNIVALIESSELISISLGGNIIPDLSPLTRLDRLKTLMLDNMEIDDISILSEITSLEGLHLKNNRIEDISPACGLYRLVSLSVDENHIFDASCLSELEHLNTLSINNNEIDDISFLNELHLTGLEFRNNYVSINPECGMSEPILDVLDEIDYVYGVEHQKEYYCDDRCDNDMDGLIDSEDEDCM